MRILAPLGHNCDIVVAGDPHQQFPCPDAGAPGRRMISRDEIEDVQTPALAGILPGDGLLRVDSHQIGAISFWTPDLPVSRLDDA